MGPAARYLGSDVPDAELLWQDPLPKLDHALISDADADVLKADILDAGLTVPELVKTAWASASSYRASDMRGGANGARIRLAPQKDWAVNDPRELKQVLNRLARVQKSFNDKQSGDKRVSLADVIVLGGAAAIEKAAKDAGYEIEVPFKPGRVDATQAQTDTESFAVLEPRADAFRNYYGQGNRLSPAEMLVERADLLGLTVPETTVLVGGMRVLSANAGNAKHGVFTDKPGRLSNDFFVNLLDISTQWSKAEKADGVYEGRDRATGKVKWTATPVDLIFGSNAELRAVAEVYASQDGGEQFVQDFVNAWTKVMTADRFDL
jgi:catalase-peroxidase